MVGGAAPAEDGSQIVLSLSRLNRVRGIDPVDMTMEIEAGVTLKAAQEAASDAGCLLPLSISSEGSAQIGGVLATNAGGNNTVRYGNARDLVLGLEVVLADGQVWNGLRRLHKDNTGYCLRQLFVGSEGTLGIITAAVLKLYPQPHETAVALCAIGSPEAALDLFNRLQLHDPASIQAYRIHVWSRRRSGPATRPRRDIAVPRPGPFLCAGRAGDAAGGGRSARLARSRARRGDRGGHRRRRGDRRKRRAAGGAVAAARGAFGGAETGRRVGQERCFGAGLESAGTDPPRHRGLRAAGAGHQCVPFGHLGDGNIHVNLVQPEAADPASFLARDHELMDAVNEIVRDLDGSFSAEHGIGRLKPYMMPDWRGGPELDLMRRIKMRLTRTDCSIPASCSPDYSGHAPPGNGMICTSLPAGSAGACGGRTTRQSEEASGRIIEKSCTSNGMASRTPSAARTSRARR